ncbi:MAG: exopolysaccharide Pel transporter PelG [Planctomycetota bacterium]
MAGIGFELRRMIDQRGGFLSKVRAYAAAGLISSGPWLMTILTLSLLNLLAPKLGVTERMDTFRTLVTYAFAFSLVLVGAGQMAITRRVADLLYSKKYERVLPAFNASMLCVGVLAGLIATVFCIVAEFSVALSFVSISLFMIISLTWLALTWLSVAREYDMVLRAYVYGTLISVGGIGFCLLTDETVGILAAYTAGQAFTLVLLTRTIVRGMESGGRRDFTVLRALRSFPRLVGVGLFYNLAIWIDKMIFWFRAGEGPHPLLQYEPLYDTYCFLAYLTVVPALAVNLIRLETSFYETYREYYGAILAGTPLAYIEEKRNRMFETLQESTIRLLRVQGAITVLVIVFAPVITDWLELDSLATRVFRLAALGAFFHVMLLLTILMQMYFDLRAQAAGTSLVFLLLNGGLAWWSVERGEATWGVGYCAAAFLSLLLGYSLLHRSLERLDYLTFTGQPIDDGEVPLDDEEEVAAEKKRSAEAADGMPEEDEDEETDAEVAAPAERPARDLPTFDPVVYPVPLRDVERIAARQMDRGPETPLDILPDPFALQDSIDAFAIQTQTEIELLLPELETEPDDETRTWTGPEAGETETAPKVDME